MRKMYLVVLAVMFFGVALYLFFTVRQDINRKMSVTTNPPPPSQDSDKRAVEDPLRPSVTGTEPSGRSDNVVTC